MLSRKGQDTTEQAETSITSYPVSACADVAQKEQDDKSKCQQMQQTQQTLLRTMLKVTGKTPSHKVHGM